MIDKSLVFYRLIASDWNKASQRIEDAGIELVRSVDLEWDRMDKPYREPEGYRTVIPNATWVS